MYTVLFLVFFIAFSRKIVMERCDTSLNGSPRYYGFVLRLVCLENEINQLVNVN